MNAKILIAIIVAIAIASPIAFYFGLQTGQTEKLIPSVTVNGTQKIPSQLLETKDGIIKFESFDEIKDYLNTQNIQYQSNYVKQGGIVSFPGGNLREGVIVDSVFPVPMVAQPTSPESPDVNQAPKSDNDFSKTNIQVKNVDEPDYIKSDGKYLYIVNQNWLTIIDAYPADTSKVVLKIALDIEQQNLENIFLNGNKLVIFYYGSAQTYGITQYDYAPYPIYTPKTFATIIDVSDKEKPKTVSKFEFDGSYTSSRMIENIVYLVTNSGIDYTNPVLPKIMDGPTMILPDVYRFPNPEPSYTFNTVTAFDVSGKLHTSETFLMGYSNTIYVSENNLYITYQKNIPYTYYDTIGKNRFFEVIVPLLPKDIQSQINSIQNDATLDPYARWIKISALLQDTYNNLPKDEKERLFMQIQKSLEDYDARLQSDVTRTVIHKIGLNGGSLKYVANTEVPGFLLNQFSMDENGNRFRIATTSDSFSRGQTSPSSNVYVFDENLKQVGSLTKIAPDERIYSSRFMGDKLYLVTFKQIDPFFVIDLSSDSPKILGLLKIPGFSNYLQPFDKDHIIGIGRDTKQNEWGGVQTNGVKLSIFDVSDFKNPKETDTIVIGTNSIDSEALYNHKALLLDKEKNVLSIPIKGDVKEIFDKTKPGQQYSAWNGFFVYGFSNGKFVEKGTISHYTGSNFNTIYMPARSLYINDTLYTIMDGSIKMNDLQDVSKEINSIKIGSTGKLVPILDK